MGTGSAGRVRRAGRSRFCNTIHGSTIGVASQSYASLWQRHIHLHNLPRGSLDSNQRRHMANRKSCQRLNQRNHNLNLYRE